MNHNQAKLLAEDAQYLYPNHRVWLRTREPGEPPTNEEHWIVTIQDPQTRKEIAYYTQSEWDAQKHPLA